VKLGCPYCTHEVSPETTQCPSCGTTYGSRTQQFLRKMVQEAVSDLSGERRRHDRIPVRYKISYATAEELKAHYLSNISLGGVFVETKNPLTRGARFNLTIFLPDGGKNLEVFCEVVWSFRGERVTNSGTHPPGMGLKFLNLSPEDEDRIERLLRTISK
jgi:uncharacterized protein (TIGR02266 family)